MRREDLKIGTLYLYRGRVVKLLSVETDPEKLLVAYDWEHHDWAKPAELSEYKP